MHLFLAIFWIIVGVTINFYWEDLQRQAFVNFPRHWITFFCFVLFSYNFIRWRLERARQRVQKEDLEPPPRPRHREYDPTFDFTKPDPDDNQRKDEQQT